jgi:uncharacterized protein (TIRG00374 family)
VDVPESDRLEDAEPGPVLPPARKHETPFAWKAVVKRSIMIAVAGLVIYLLFPKITEVLGSWPELHALEPVWFAVAVAAQAGHFMCTFALQRIALRARAWFPVVTSQLAGNSISLIMPGGAAAGAAVQFRMLTDSGTSTVDTVGGLAAFSLLGVGGLFALPVVALPVILAGSPIAPSLYGAAILGSIGFVLFAGVSAVVLVADAPLRWTGRILERAHNLVFRRRPPLGGLDHAMLRERDQIRTVLGREWWQAVLLSSGRLGLDYLTLLAAVRATGSHPRPSLILVAYAVAGIIGLVPITPGGLGIVEASLTGLLVLAGMGSGNALLATLTYRLASYWLPLVLGPVAYGAFRHRYHKRPSPPAAGPEPA